MISNFGNKKSKKYRSAMVLTSIILILNIAIGYFADNLSPLNSIASFFLNPVQRTFYKLNDRVEKTIDFFFRFSEVEKENDTLRKKNAEYEDKVRKFEELQRENVELKAMFTFKNRYSQYNYVGTNVINKNLNSISPSYTLDKGSNDGIKKGMVVITYEGLAGQITEVFPNHCILETISSQNVKVSVTSAGKKSYVGILSGTPVLDKLKKAEISQLSLESDIKKDDFIVTSGIGKFYPPDLPVGSIESVAEDKGKLMKTAVVKPIVTFNGYEVFYIVLPKNQEDVTY